jgi:hypothetical protein
MGGLYGREADAAPVHFLPIDREEERIAVGVTDNNFQVKTERIS